MLIQFLIHFVVTVFNLLNRFSTCNFVSFIIHFAFRITLATFNLNHFSFHCAFCANPLSGIAKFFFFFLMRSINLTEWPKSWLCILIVNTHLSKFRIIIITIIIVIDEVHFGMIFVWVSSFNLSPGLLREMIRSTKAGDSKSTWKVCDAIS